MSEREFTPTEALFNIMSTIHTLELSATARFTTPSKLVATADLNDRDNNIVESGAGKGPDSLIGALAESIEHFSTFHFLGDPSWHCTDTIASQKEASLDGLFTSLPRGESIECFRLTSLDHRDELYVPIALLRAQATQILSQNIGPAMQFLSRYASNSGIAFGCTENEALLHGTQEIIERHILSLFFMGVSGIGPKMELYAPSPDLLEIALQNDPSALELAEQLQIVVIKDVFSVYFAVAFPRTGPGNHHLSPIGSGCSLDICLAIQRAVTEQFQSWNLYDSTEEFTDRKTLEFLSCSKKLKTLIDFSPVRNLKLPELECPRHVHTETVSNQLVLLHEALRRSGKKIFRRTVARFSTNCIVAQTYIPGLERFNIIRNGRMVAPQHILRSS